MSAAVRMTILANAAQAKKELDGFAAKAQSSTGKVGSTMAKFGKVAALGVAAAGVAVVGFAASAVKSASNAQQSLGATETVFGQFAKNVVKTSADAAKKYGLSANTYRENANLIGSLFKNQGVATDELAGKTEKIVGVGADLAATFGGTTSDAVSSLGAAFKGEFDSLEKYGISLKESTISAELAARGQDKLTGAALAAAKQQVTSDLIMKQSKDSLGAFGRESNTLANQQQILGAQFENVKAKVGAALLPVLTSAAAFLNNTLFPAVEKMLPSIKAFASELGDKLAPVVAKVGAFLSGTLVPALAKFGGFVIGTVVPAVISLATKVGGNLRPVLDAVVDVVKKVVAKFKEWSPAIQSTVAAVAKIIGKVVEFASKVLGVVLPVVIKFAGLLLTTLVPVVVTVVSTVAKVIGKVIEFGGAVVDGAKKVADFAVKVGQKIAEAVDFVRDLPSKAKAALGNLGTLLLNAGKELIQGLIDGIDAKIQAVKDKMADLAGAIKGFLPGSPVKEGPLTSWNNGRAGKRLIDLLVVGIDGAKATVNKSMERLTSVIGKALDKSYDGKALDRHTAKVQKALKDEIAGVNRAASAYDRIKDRLVAAQDELARLTQQQMDYAASVKQSVIDFGNLVGLGLRQDADGNEVAASAQTIIDDLKKKAADAEAFTKLIADLTASGLNDTSLQQLLAAGVEGGLATAQAIALGGAGAITEINDLTEKIAAAGAAVGNSAAQKFYGEGVNAAAQMVLGVQSELVTQTAALTAAMGALGLAAQEALADGLSKGDKAKQAAKAIADAIKEEVKQALGIDLDDFTQPKGKGKNKGKNNKRANLDTSALNAFNAANTHDSNRTVKVQFSATQIDQLSRGRAIQADLDAFGRAGGRRSA